jgi:electron transport complex protein RnfG
MKRNDLVKTLIIMLSTVIATVGLALLLNLHTGPIIEANKAGAENEALNAVMPGATGFEEITSTLTIDPSTGVTNVYKEKSGNGYVFKATKDGFSKPVNVVVGVNTSGVITGITVEIGEGDFGVNDMIPTFIGQDSTLANVVLQSGATISSTAVKNAVEAGLLILTDNGLVQAGVKSDAQILEELISTVFSSFKKSDETLAVSGNITSASRLANDAGFVYLMTKGESTYLAICNNFNVCKVFTYTTDEATGDVSLVDVTSENEDLASEAKAHAASNLKSQVETAIKKFKSITGSEEITEVSNIDVFNSVVAVVEITIEGAKYYGFYSRSYGFHDMDVFVVLDSEGKIYKTQANTLIFEEEFFMFNDKGIKYEGIPTDYYQNMVGVGSGDLTADTTLITAATMTSNAMNVSLKDAFAAYDKLAKGGNN